MLPQCACLLSYLGSVYLLHQSADSLVTPHRFVRLLFGKTSQNWCSCGVVPQIPFEIRLKFHRICVLILRFTGQSASSWGLAKRDFSLFSYCVVYCPKQRTTAVFLPFCVLSAFVTWHSFDIKRDINPAAYKSHFPAWKNPAGMFQRDGAQITIFWFCLADFQRIPVSCSRLLLHRCSW